LRRILLSFSFQLLLLAPVANADRDDDSDSITNAAGVDRRCEASIERAAGDYSRCLLRAYSNNARQPDASRLERAEQRCADRFDKATDRALARAEKNDTTCTPYTSEIAFRVFNFAASVAREAGGTASPSYLYVQNGGGGTISGTTLTLTGVSDDTIWFTDRPYRDSGKVTTAEFIAPWYEGEDSFGEIPPNADFTCEVENETVNYTVELLSPSLAGGDLSYSVIAVGDTVLPQTEISCNTEAYLLIDCCYK